MAGSTPTTATELKTSSRLFDITPLANDGSNYLPWKFRNRTILEIKDLFGHCDGTDACPEPTKDNAKVDEIALWKSRDRDARTQIMLTIGDEPLSGVMHAKTAQEAWTILKDRYEGKGNQTIAYLIGDLFRGTLDDTTSLETQLNTMLQKGHTITSLGQSMDDALIAIAMVISLPDSYSTLRTILMSAEGTLSTEKVIMQVLREEKERKRSTETALLARRGPQQQPQRGQPGANDKKPPRVQCDYCHKRGHIKDECRKLKAAQNGQNGQNGGANTANPPKQLTAKVARAGDEESQTLYLLIAAAAAQRGFRTPHWVLDSGASCSMSSQRELFHALHPLSSPLPVHLGDDRKIFATHIGRIALKLATTDSTYTVSLTGVYYIPELAGNLLSLSDLSHRGFTFNFGPNGCNISNTKNEFQGRARLENGLYLVECSPVTPARALIARVEGADFTNVDQLDLTALAVTGIPQKISEGDYETWHRRCGHANYDLVRRLASTDMVEGMKVTGTPPEDAVCDACMHGRQTRSVIPTTTTTTNPRVLHRMFSDVCGPLEVETPQKEKYFATYTDSKSHYLQVALLKHKSDVSTKTKAVIKRAKVETGQVLGLNFLRTDGGGEYCSQEFEDFLKSEGVHHEKTNPDTPQENGVSERANRTLVEKVRCMLSDSKMPKKYWGYALQYAAYILNRLPTRALEGNITPYEAYFGIKPSVAELRIFGCKAYVHIPDKYRHKLDPKTVECRFLGFAEDKHAYVLVQRSNGRIIVSRDVVFDEGSGAIPSHVHIEVEPHNSAVESAEQLADNPSSSEAEVEALLEPAAEEDGHPEPEPQPAPRRSARLHKAPTPDDDPR